MRPVNSKLDFVSRYLKEEFGNRAPSWNTLSEFFDYYKLEFPPDDQLFHIRSKLKGGPTYYDLTWQQIVRTTFCGQYYVSAMAPTEKTLIQGEVQRIPGGLHLFYSKLALPMRQALARESHTADGLVANLLLQEYMDGNSWDWLNYLLDNYSDHVIEFSTYSTQWGTIKGFNTVFWEVRNY